MYIDLTFKSCYGDQDRSTLVYKFNCYANNTKIKNTIFNEIKLINEVNYTEEYLV